MLIASTAGPRTLWHEGSMAGEYDRPGVEFVASEAHDYDIDHAAARVRASVGETLAELRDDIVIVDREDADAGSDSEGEDTQDETTAGPPRDARGRFIDRE
jgi:hypothetical protein